MRRPIISILQRALEHKFECLFALLITAGLLGAVFMPGTDDLRYGPAVMCPLLAGLLAVIHGYRTKALHFPLNATTLLMAGFFGYLILSTTWAVVPYTAAYFLLILLLMPLLFIAIICTGKTETMLRYALTGTGVVVIGVMIWTLIQFFFLNDQGFRARMKHPFLDPNNLAAFLNMAFLPLLALSFRHQPRATRFIYAGLTLMFFIALLVTYSRMALLGAGISFLVMMPVVIRQTKRPSVTALALIGTAAAIILLANYFTEGSLFSYMHEILSFEKSVSMTERMALWMASLRIFGDHFWLGTGLASFFYFYPQYRQPDDASDGYFAHMDPLQLGLETGIIGYVLIYAFLIAVLCRTIRVIRQPHLTGADRLMVLAPFCGLLTLCIHMHMTFCLYLPANTIPVGVLLAWWYVVTQRYVRDPVFDLSYTRGKIVTGRSVILRAWALVWAGQATAGIYFNLKTANATARGDLAAAEDSLRWQYRLSPASSHRPYEREAEIAIRALKASGNATLITRRTWFERGLRATEQAIERQPRHGSLRNQKAVLLYLAGEDVRPGAVDKAINVLRGILRTDPMMIDARIGLANILQGRGEFAMALRVMEEGMVWPRPKGMPDVNYIAMTAQLNLLNGRKERHDQLIQFAMERARLYGFTVTPSP